MRLLFQDGEFTGYIDFDLSQRNIRVFDLCYFLMGLLAERDNQPDRKTWFQILSDTAAGYESRVKMTDAEKEAFPWVMENIEILFAAWFAGSGDMRAATGTRTVTKHRHNRKKYLKCPASRDMIVPVVLF